MHEYNIEELKELASIYTKANNNGSGLDLKGISAEQMFVLMATCQAEGINPALVNKRYTMVMGKPTLKADTLLADFIANKGRITWLELTDRVARAIYKHPSLDGELELCVTIEDLKKSGQANTPTWKKYPRQMLRNALNREAIKTICPVLCAEPEPEIEMPAPRRTAAQLAKAEVATDNAGTIPTEKEIPEKNENDEISENGNENFDYERAKKEDLVRKIMIKTFLAKTSEDFERVCQDLVGRKVSKIENLTDQEIQIILDYQENLADGLSSSLED